MNKRGDQKKFGRVRSQRKALYKALALALVDKKKIKTTEVKAKSLSRFIEKQITKAKKGDIASIRLLSKELTKETVKKLVHDIAPKFKEKKGGYTRIIKLGRRMGDGASMAIIEFTE